MAILYISSFVLLNLVKMILCYIYFCNSFVSRSKLYKAYIVLISFMILMSKTIFQCSFKDHMHYIHQEENDAHPVMDEAIVTLEPVSHTGLNIYTI